GPNGPCRPRQPRRPGGSIRRIFLSATATGRRVMIDEERGQIEYEVSGAGPTIGLVPGSCSTGARWRGGTTVWVNQFLWAPTSLLGYGQPAEWRTSCDTSIAHEAEVMESVIRQARGRVHLVGHSFGGLVALAVTLRRRVALATLTVIEAPAPQLLKATGEEQ